MIDKRVSRILAVQGVCALCSTDQRDFRDFDFGQYVDDLTEVATTEPDVVGGNTSNSKFLYRLVKYCLLNLDEIDGHIARCITDEWQINRIQSVCMGIIRTGVSEVMSCPNNRLGMIISEYMAISDMFVDGEEASFVHAILDKIGNELRSATAQNEAPQEPS